MAEWKTAGKVRMTPKGAWSSSVAYEILDCVSSTDSLKYYIAKQNVPAGTALTNTTYWEPIANLQAAADRAVEIAQDLEDEVADLKSASTLQAENVPDTVQSITFDSAGNVAQITHTRNSVAIRTDVFTFAENTITEVRTLNTGEKLTIVTNTDTLQTTVTYAAA